MKKKLLSALLALVLSIPAFVWAQSTETFESYTTGKPTTFTNNAQAFTIVTNDCVNGGTFGVFIPGQNWSKCAAAGSTLETSTGTGYGIGTSCAYSSACASVSNNFIDNGPSTGTNQIYSIKTSNAALFTIKSLYIYVSTNQASSPATSGVTFTGMKGGNTVFTVTPGTFRGSERSATQRPI